MKTRLTSKIVLFWRSVLPFLVVSVLLTSLFVQPAAAAPGDQIFFASGDLSPGETNTPGFPVFSTRNVNVKLYVPDAGGTGTIDLTFTDGTGANTFNGTIQDGETLWANVTVKPGSNNVFDLQNTSGGGGPDLDYYLWVYEIDDAPFNWSGTSQGAGTWRSEIQLNFPSSGLYQFDFGAASGRYQILLDDDYIQKTVEISGTVSYYVAAGVHQINIEPDTASANTSWSLDIASAGAATDTLPYMKTGGNLGGTGNDFDEEWLPLNLASATETNFEFTLIGAASDAVDVYLYGATGSTPVYSVMGVYGGETLWWTTDLSAGVSRVRLVADGGNTGVLAYALTINAKPDMPASWAGDSLGIGNQSVVHFEVSTAGLYEFDYGVTSGRYQFLVDSDPHIQKTVESGDTVSYYLAAGTHELTVVQDSTQGAAWSLAIAATGQTSDSLPYAKTGGDLGGTGNDFDEEWLPVNVAAGGPVNFELTLTGDLADGLVAYLYQGNTQVDATPVMYGGETFWWTADLATGVNHVQLVAEGGNTNSLAYELTIHSVDTPPANWSGVAKDSGGNSEALVNIATAGTYQVTLLTPTGFAKVLIDDTVVTALPGNAPTGHDTEFDVPLSAGNHSFKVVQDPAYPTTEWSIDVASTTTDQTIAHFTGDLDPGVTISPEIPLFGAPQDVNFSLEVSGGGGPLDLTISNELPATAFTGTAYDGEVVWGTVTLQTGQNTFELENTGGSALTYDLTVYTIDSTPYNWAGDSVTAGAWDSHIKLNFASDDLYDFDFGAASGRYQILVDNEYIQKTVEADGTVAYFMPQGEHLLTIVPDRTGTDTSWSLDISGTGAVTDTLPYLKTGGDLGGAGNVFNEEWLSVNLMDATETNFEFTLTGDAGDSMDVYLYGAVGTTPVYTVTDVYGGETLWWTTDLPADVSRMQLVADPGNTNELAYALTIHAKPDVPASWAGDSLGMGNHSVVHFDVTMAGLYEFDYGVTSGRYQFLVNSDSHIQKTVEVSGTVSYYLDAGTHELTVMQDSTQGAAWSLAIAATGETYDSLPYAKIGGDLGGAGNDFDTEWLPVNMATGGAVNFELTLTGDLADGLVAYLYQGSTQVYTTPVVYGGETFWWTADLATGVNHVMLVTDAGNTNMLEYDLTIHSVPMVAYNLPYTWDGLSKGQPAPIGYSEIMLQAPVSGTYHVVLDIPNGFATIHIDEAAVVAHAARQSHIEFDIPLDEGEYLFEIQQSTAYITTTWAVTLSLKDALAPEIISIDPVTVTNDMDHALSIWGANFQPGIEVTIDGTALTPITRTNASQLDTIVPAGVPTGVYTVTVTNPDGKSAFLPNALTVVEGEVNDPPFFTSTPLTTITETLPYTYMVTADDIDPGDVLTITAPTLPDWLTLTDNGDGTATLSGTPTSVDIGDHAVTLQVHDSGGLFDTQTFTITVTAVEPTEYHIYLPLVFKDSP